ncbi:MAG: hypothetical protein PUB32_01640, partial [Clostridiales bacterium]|nr:hypothetical protein [Clostridiales bacterium]
LRQRESNPCRFFRADFRPCCVNGLENTPSILCARFLAWTKIRSVKTARHIPARNVRGIFVAADAALLTQGKDNKAKSAEQGRRNAVRVRLPLP